MTILSLIEFPHFEYLYTGECSFRIFAPFEDDGVLFDLTPFYIFKIVFFYDLSGEFILHEFLPTGLSEGSPLIRI